MTWLWMAAGKHGTHHGVLDGATVRADCGTNFPTSGTLRLELAPGEKPGDPAQICSECRIVCRIVWGSSR